MRAPFAELRSLEQISFDSEPFYSEARWVPHTTSFCRSVDPKESSMTLGYSWKASRLMKLTALSPIEQHELHWTVHMHEYNCVIYSVLIPGGSRETSPAQNRPSQSRCKVKFNRPAIKSTAGLQV